MVLSLTFPMKLMKRNGKPSSDAFPFNHPRQRHGAVSNDDSSSLGTTATLDDDSTSFNASNGSWDQTTSSRNKSVTFSLSLNEEYSNDVMVKSEIRELWYQPSEYQTFRTMALDASQQIIATEKRNRAPHSYQRVMERIYTACCNHSASINDMMTNVECDDDNDMNHVMDEDDDRKATSSVITSEFEVEMNIDDTTVPHITAVNDKSILSDDDFVHLQRWLEVGSTRIGLEKWSIRTIATSRSTRRDTIVETIMSIQQEKLLTQARNAIMMHSSMKQQHESSLDIDCAEFIRGTSERLSRPSSLFCRVMAQGLAAAVAKENMFITL